MNLPSTLPSPPRLEPNVAHANNILNNGYHAARNILDLVHPNLNQLHYHREHIWSELIPLLDTILESTSDAATRSWCCRVTETIADLFNRLVECEASAQHKSAVLMTAAMDINKHLIAKGYLLSAFTQSLLNGARNGEDVPARPLMKPISRKQHTRRGIFQKRDSQQSLGSTETLSRRWMNLEST